MNTISRTLALLKPADLFPAWKWIDIMEECGEIEPGEAKRWKEGIYGLMVLWSLALMMPWEGSAFRAEVPEVDDFFLVDDTKTKDRR